MKRTILLYCLIATGCSTANNWKPQYTLPDPKYVQICEQHGSKLYDRDTGKECLTHEQQRRKDAQGVHHAGAPR